MSKGPREEQEEDNPKRLVDSLLTCLKRESLIQEFPRNYTTPEMGQVTCAVSRVFLSIEAPFRGKTESNGTPIEYYYTRSHSIFGNFFKTSASLVRGGPPGIDAFVAYYCADWNRGNIGGECVSHTASRDKKTHANRAGAVVFDSDRYRKWYLRAQWWESQKVTAR